MEAFTTKGHWWLPKTPGHKVEGKLSFDPGGGSMLELSDVLKFLDVIFLGTFTDTESIILGEDDEGKTITLISCSEEPVSISSESSLPRGVLAYRPRFIALGCHVDREEDFVFSQLTVDYYGLQVWADPRRRAGFSRPNANGTDESSIDDILVCMEGFNVRIRRNFPQESESKVESDERFAMIDFLADNPWKFDEFLKQIFFFQTFLGLAMHTSTWPVLVQAPHPEENSEQISIHYAPVTDYQEVDKLNSTFMYFTLEDALPYLEQGLTLWFEKTEKLYRVLQMYSRAISMKMFLEEEFMIYARAVEVYHRQIHDEPYIDDSDYEKISEALKETLSSLMPTCKSERYKSLEQAIHSSLKYANRPSLRRRLKDTGERYRIYNERLFENYKDFVDDVVNTRNYLTHFDENDKQRAKLGFRDLYSMRERLRVILEIGLLSELGLSESQIQDIIFGSAVSVPL